MRGTTEDLSRHRRVLFCLICLQQAAQVSASEAASVSSLSTPLAQIGKQALRHRSLLLDPEPALPGLQEGLVQQAHLQGMPQGQAVQPLDISFTQKLPRRPKEEWEPLLIPTVQNMTHIPPLTTQEIERRKGMIWDAANHSWQGYVRHAWGKDELGPIYNTSADTFGGLGATVVDSLDTLWLMGMAEEFRRARDFVADFSFDKDVNVSVFETTIRMVGGLLSAYQLSSDTIFIKKAEDLAQRLMPAWQTPTGIPHGSSNLHSLQPNANPEATAILSEFGTEQMEMMTLAHMLDNAMYRDKVVNVIRTMQSTLPDEGLKPILFHTLDGRFTTEEVSVGAMGDSYYEYLLKVWLLTNKTQEMYRAMWEQAMDDMIASLLFESTPSRLKYIANYGKGFMEHRMEHLACFIPAMLALGVHQGAVQNETAKRYMALAEDLTYTCWQMYETTWTGLSGEFAVFLHGQDFQVGMRHWLMRPEAMEAFFVLWRVTGNAKYREWGWRVFEAVELHCRVPSGYTGVVDVLHGGHDNVMQTFWIAETLKYVWLMYSDAIPLDQWVFNTEAHPMKVFESQPKGKRRKQNRPKGLRSPRARSSHRPVGPANQQT